MARRCIYSLSLFVCHQPSTAAPQQQYADSGMMAPPPPPFFFFFMGAVEYFISWQSFRVRLHILFFFLSELSKCARTCWRSGRGNGEQRTGGGKKTNSAQRRCRERWKEGIKKQKEKCSQFPSCSFTTLPPFCPDRLVARYACWGPILFSAGSQCWFCLIGWFATSLLIDNHRREILISPSAE